MASGGIVWPDPISRFIPALEQTLHHEDKTLRQAAVGALREIGDEAAVNALSTALHDEVSALFTALNDEDFWASWAAGGALVRIGDTQLLAQLVPNLRQGSQNTKRILGVISALQRRFKIYRADTFWPQSTGTKSPPAEKTMRTLRVVLASPSDVRPERDVLPDVIEELNRNLGAVLHVDLKLDRWETDAYPGFYSEGPQGLIDSILRIDDSDLLIGIFWKRFGTPTMPTLVQSTNFVPLTTLGKTARNSHADPISWSTSRTRPIRHPRRKNSTSGAKCWNSKKHFPNKVYGGLSRPPTSSRNWCVSTCPAGCGTMPDFPSGSRPRCDNRGEAPFLRRQSHSSD